MSHDGEYKFDDPWITGLVKELQDENKALRAQLEALTPGGSEFHDNPNRCLEWVRDRLSTTAQQVKARKEVEAQLAADRKQLEYVGKYAEYCSRQWDRSRFAAGFDEWYSDNVLRVEPEVQP